MVKSTKTLSKNNSKQTKKDDNKVKASKASKKDKKVKNLPRNDEEDEEVEVVSTKTKSVRQTKNSQKVVLKKGKDSQNKNITKIITKKDVKEDKKSVKKGKNKAEKIVNGGKTDSSKNKTANNNSQNNITNNNVKNPRRNKKVADKDEDKNTTIMTTTTTTITNNVTVIEKGGAVVDKEVPNFQNYHVVKDTLNELNRKFFNATMNCSDLKNNNNKFYFMQILCEDNTNNYFLFTRWGRVGQKGQQSLQTCTGADNAKKEFIRKYMEKTSKNYTEIDIDYSKDEEKKEVVQKKTSSKINKTNKNVLPKPIQELIELIYNKNIMNQQMKEIGYDASKMPLGKLGKTTLEEGYKILKEIEKVLDSGKGDLYELSSKFYSKIPHNFGFQKMCNFLIKDKSILKAKVDMLQSLNDIEIATKILDETEDSETDVYYSHYEKLGCEIKHISSHEQIFSTLETFLINTSSDYSYHQLELIEAFEVKKEKDYKDFIDHGNKKLLWHGSRITNYVGILSQGLRIAPPEAPASGYNFGKGIYFADMASKSACYCYPSNNIAIIMLCEVSLGNPNELVTTDINAANLPHGKHSTKGCGVTVPNSEIDLEDGVKMPNGKPIKSTLKTLLGYNEYIVYDTNQVKLRYLLKIKFNKK